MEAGNASPLSLRSASRHAYDRHQDNDGMLTSSPSSQMTPTGQSSTPVSRARWQTDSDASLTRRRVAAEWAQSVSGSVVPYTSDHLFRGALQDGVVLCRLANHVRPAMVPQVLEVDGLPEGPDLDQRRRHNVDAFLAALAPLLPEEALFEADDLASNGYEERPRITECILRLRHMAEGHSAAASGLPASPSFTACSRASLDVASQHETGPLHSMAGLSTPPGSSMQSPSAAGSPHMRTPPGNMSAVVDGYNAAQHSAAALTAAGLSRSYSVGGSSMVPRGGALYAVRDKSVEAAAGVAKLMQQCTQMLQQRMYHDAQRPARAYGAAPVSPNHTMDQIGPVLENVLGSLTQEYEKRLLAKDHELSRTRDNATSLQKQVYTLSAEVQSLSDKINAAQEAAREAAARAASADVHRLQDELAAAQESARQQQERLNELSGSLDAASSAKEAREVALELEVQALREQLAALEDIEGRYLRVVDENRRLYNTVQDLRGAIRVFCRIRPPGATGDPSPPCVDVGLEGDLAVYDGRVGGERKVFKVDCIFEPPATQTEVYTEAQPLIRSVLDGYNVCIFAYGQTGSGKTHTMSGTDTAHTMGQGINYRALNDLFGIRDARAHEVEYTIRVQMLEIYNEALRDLLVREPNQRLDILSTQASGENVPGAQQIQVTDAREVAAIMTRGAANRHTSETKMNDRSSRSHQILTVIVDGCHLVSGARSHGCLHLIDLAGSERVGKSEASGERLVEAQHINRSLSALGDVMAALASKSQHVPFRNSKLTQLLQDSLSGQAKVMMFMHISPEANMHGETLSTLKFASRVSEITLGQAHSNVQSGQVFAAHELAEKARASAAAQEEKTSQALQALQAEQAARLQLQRDLHMAGQDRDSLIRETQELRAQLEAAKKAALLASSQQRSPMQLQQASSYRQLSPGPVAALAAEHSGSSSLHGSPVMAGSSAPRNMYVPRLSLDRTPPKDQDMAALSARSGSSTQRSSLAPEFTPRGTLMPPRENSSHRHIERLNAARLRQSGVGLPPQPSLHSASGGGLKREISSGLRREASASSCPSRPRTGEVAMPLTSRVSGTLKAKASDVMPTYSSRQAGMYRPASGSATASAMAGGAGSRQPVLGSSTARGGSRWK